MYMTSPLHNVIVLTLLLAFLHICSGGWGEWSPWSACSQTCGMGKQTRTRPCKPTAGQECFYANETAEVGCAQEKICPPINGGFSNWSPWSNCSRRCGGGIQMRSRTCDNPTPMHEGKTCEGEYSENRKCAVHQCPPLYSKNDTIDCDKGYVVCGNNIDCIVAYHRCDGFYDCDDGTDESACVEGEPIVFVKLNYTKHMSTINHHHFADNTERHAGFRGMSQRLITSWPSAHHPKPNLRNYNLAFVYTSVI